MSSFGLYSTDPAVKPFQRFLNELLSLDLKVDGNIGKVTQDAITTYQGNLGITETDKNGTCYGPLTQAGCADFIDKKYLKQSDFVDGAALLGCEVAAVEAFAMTESKEFGFLNNGFPVILFERHKFYQAVSKAQGEDQAEKYSAMYPDICNKIPGGYKGGNAEVDRLTRARKINPDAADSSASWGLFQVMGYNYALVGWPTLESFISDMCESETKQFKAFTGFIKASRSLTQAVISKDWATAAKAYNGSAYSDHTPPYDVQLANNYSIALKK